MTNPAPSNNTLELAQAIAGRRAQFFKAYRHLAISPRLINNKTQILCHLLGVSKAGKLGKFRPIFDGLLRMFKVNDRLRFLPKWEKYGTEDGWLIVPVNIQLREMDVTADQREEGLKRLIGAKLVERKLIPYKDKMGKLYMKSALRLNANKIFDALDGLEPPDTEVLSVMPPLSGKIAGSLIKEEDAFPSDQFRTLKSLAKGGKTPEPAVPAGNEKPVTELVQGTVGDRLGDVLPVEAPGGYPISAEAAQLVELLQRSPFFPATTWALSNYRAIVTCSKWRFCRTRMSRWRVEIYLAARASDGLTLPGAGFRPKFLSGDIHYFCRNWRLIWTSIQSCLHQNETAVANSILTRARSARVDEGIGWAIRNLQDCWNMDLRQSGNNQLYGGDICRFITARLGLSNHNREAFEICVWLRYNRLLVPHILSQCRERVANFFMDHPEIFVRAEELGYEVRDWIAGTAAESFNFAAWLLSNLAAAHRSLTAASANRSEEVRSDLS